MVLQFKLPILRRTCCLFAELLAIAHATPRCFSASSAVDRNASHVRIVNRNWLSHQVVSTIFEIILRELMGFNVIMNYGTSEDAKDVGELMALNRYDLDPESWHLGAESAVYQEYVVRKSVIIVSGTIGYAGRSGIYVNSALQAMHDLSDYFKYWTSQVLVDASGALMHGQDDLRAFLKDEFPQCDPNAIGFCGNGTLEGYWAPPPCQSNPEKCAQLFLLTPFEDTGYVEQLTNNHGLLLVHAWYGSSTRTSGKIADVIASGKNTIFYWWTPDPFILRLNATRVSFPDYVPGCQDGNTGNPTGPVMCDFASTPLVKVVRKEFARVIPEAHYVIKKLEVMINDIEDIMSNTTIGGGSLTTFEAACAWVKSKPMLIAQAAPQCLTNPVDDPKIGDLVWDPVAMACSAARVYPAVLPLENCFANPHGMEDRSSEVIKICRRDWLSHDIASTVLEIILREFVRVKVVRVDIRSQSTFNFGQNIEEDACDLDVEQWQATENGFNWNTYVVQRQSVLYAGTVGYTGRSGAYVNKATVAKSMMSDYWRFYTDSSRLSTLSMDFLKLGDFDLRVYVGAAFPACNKSEIPWCGTGNFSGYWVPQRCQPDPQQCAIMIMQKPTWDTGYLEQNTKNLGLNLVHAYAGTAAEVLIQSIIATMPEKDFLFYAWEPDPLVAKLQSARLSLPDYSYGCDAENNRDVATGAVACDFQFTLLKKMVTTRLLSTSKVGLFVIKNFGINSDGMNRMFLTHELVEGGSLKTFQAACEYVKEQHSSIKADIAPDCVTSPKQISDLVAGDSFFDASSITCRTFLSQESMSAPIAEDTWRWDTPNVIITACLCIALLLSVPGCLLWLWHKYMHSKYQKRVYSFEKPILSNLDVERALDKLIARAQNAVESLDSWLHLCKRRAARAELQAVLLQMSTLPLETLAHMDLKHNMELTGAGDETIEIVQNLFQRPTPSGPPRFQTECRKPVDDKNTEFEGIVPSPSEPRNEPRNATDDTFQEICERTYFDIFVYAGNCLTGKVFLRLFDMVVNRGINALCPLNLELPWLADTLVKAESSYEDPYGATPNAYHTALHGADTFCTTMIILRLVMVSRAFLHESISHLTMFSAAIAALFHDYRHPGVQGSFLVTINDPLALLHSDDAVLEKMHSAAMFDLFHKSGKKWLTTFSDDRYRTFRRTVIDMVLATDFSVGLKTVAAVKSSLSGDALDISLDPVLVQQILNLVIECADISHPTKPWPIHLRWSMLVTQEFLRQGQLEKERGIPVSPLCKPTNVDSFSKGQQGFIDFCVAPKFRSLSLVCDRDIVWVKQLEVNHTSWGSWKNEDLTEFQELCRQVTPLEVKSE